MQPFDTLLHGTNELCYQDQGAIELRPNMKSGSEPQRFAFKTKGGQTIDSFINSCDRHQSTPKQVAEIASEP